MPTSATDQSHLLDAGRYREPRFVKGNSSRSGNPVTTEAAALMAPEQRQLVLDLRPRVSLSVRNGTGTRQKDRSRLLY